MKLFLSFLILVLVSCNSGSKISFKLSPRDTIRTLCLYKSKEGIKYDVLFRVAYDTVMYVDKNETTKKKQLTRYWEYYGPEVFKLKNPDRDTLLYTRILSEYVIIDPNKNIDSILNIHQPKK